MKSWAIKVILLEHASRTSVKPFVFELLAFPSFGFGLSPGVVKIGRVDCELAVTARLGSDVAFEDDLVAAPSYDHGLFQGLKALRSAIWGQWPVKVIARSSRVTKALGFVVGQASLFQAILLIIVLAR